MKKALRIAYRILLGILTAVFVLLAVGAAFFIICDAVTVKYARILPSYEQTDIGGILAKEEWTEEDYSVLYRQTGVSKSALDGMKDDPKRILSFQEALFYKGEVVQDDIAITTSHDEMKDFTAPIVDLEDGDIIVTSSCHTFGWRNGHSALVVDSEDMRVLESRSLGIPSGYGSVRWFQKASNFIVLRLKGATKEERAEIANWATENLYKVDYSILVGISQKKDQGDKPQVTHCSHLVWQAYYHFGYDIDSDGGPVVTSRDIASSPHLEVVQVYGFDPEKLW